MFQLYITNVWELGKAPGPSTNTVAAYMQCNCIYRWVVSEVQQGFLRGALAFNQLFRLNHLLKRSDRFSLVLNSLIKSPL